MDRIVSAARVKVFKMRNISLLKKLEERNRSIMLAYVEVFYIYIKFMVFIFRKNFENEDDSKSLLLFRKLHAIDSEYKSFHANHPYVELVTCRLTLISRFTELEIPDKRVLMRLGAEQGSFVPTSVLWTIHEFSGIFWSICKVKYSEEFARDCQYADVEKLIKEKRKLLLTESFNEEGHGEMLKEIKAIEKTIEENMHLVSAFKALKTDLKTRFDAYRNGRFSKRHAESLSNYKVKEGSPEIDEGCCSICLEDYRLGERVNKLVCGHVFHRECLIRWLLVNSRCPNCNYDLC